MRHAISPAGKKILALLLVAALFLCDGAVGSAHLLPGPAATLSSFADGAADAGEPGGELPDDTYYAVVLLVVAIGAVFRWWLFGSRARRGALVYRSFEWRSLSPLLLLPERRSVPIFLPVLRL